MCTLDEHHNDVRNETLTSRSELLRARRKKKRSSNVGAATCSRAASMVLSKSARSDREFGRTRIRLERGSTGQIRPEPVELSRFRATSGEGPVQQPHPRKTCVRAAVASVLARELCGVVRKAEPRLCRGTRPLGVRALSGPRPRPSRSAPAQKRSAHWSNIGEFGRS